MRLYECKIGTLVIDPGYPEIVGYISGLAFNGYETVAIVRWPEINEYQREEMKRMPKYAMCSWVQLGNNDISIHPSNLVAY